MERQQHQAQAQASQARQGVARGLPGAFSVQEFHVLPENVPVLDLFQAVQTQWRYGQAGPTGLDYSGVRSHPAFLRVPRKRREELLGGVEVMERAYLNKAAELRQRAAQMET